MLPVLPYAYRMNQAKLREVLHSSENDLEPAKAPDAGGKEDPRIKDGLRLACLPAGCPSNARHSQQCQMESMGPQSKLRVKARDVFFWDGSRTKQESSDVF